MASADQTILIDNHEGLKTVPKYVSLLKVHLILILTTTVCGLEQFYLSALPL